MNLSSDLISQLVKATKDDTKPRNETTVPGTTVKYEGKTWVKLDGSDLLTPVSTTTDVKDGERVTVLIKDHTATITGNTSSPAARTGTVNELGAQITELGTVVADKVSTKVLEAETARIDTLVSENVTIKQTLTAAEADIKELEAENATITGKLTAAEGEITNLKTEKLDAEIAVITYATIDSLNTVDAKVYNLNATYGKFEDLTTTQLTAIDADIKRLEAEKLSAVDAEITYANIDFTNIGKAAMEYFYANSGLIRDVVVSSGTITGELVGVTLKGDLIEGNTVKADKLVVKGSDGLYYKLNFEAGTFKSGEVVPTDSLHGSVITAKSIVAEKVSVDDLVAFDATIGGFKITDTAIYSGVKESATNTTRGVYLDSAGQLSVGDSSNFIRYYKDGGVYKLEISANSIKMGAKSQTVEEYVSEQVKDITVGARNFIRNSTSLVFSDYYFSGTFIAVYDGVSDIKITCGASAFDNGNGNIVMRTSATATDDGNGNVTLS